MKVNLEYRLVKKINTTLNKLILDAISLGYVKIQDIKNIYPFIYDQHLFSAIENLTNAGLLEIDVIRNEVSLSESFSFIQSRSNSNASIEISVSNLKLLEENYNEDMKYIFFEALYDIQLNAEFRNVLRNIDIIIKRDDNNEQQ